MKVVRLLALRTGRLYPTGDSSGTHFCWRLSRLQGHSAVGRIKSVKNFNDAFGKFIGTETVQREHQIVLLLPVTRRSLDHNSRHKTRTDHR